MKRYLIFLFTVFSSGILIAGTDGTIRGKVTDIDGMGLPGANVIISELGMGAAADMDGNYILLNVPVGSYDVSVQMIGYQKQTIKEVAVTMDQSLWLNFKLPEAVVEGDEIEVLGTRPLVEKGTTSKKVTVSKETIKALPIRDLSELYTLQSGVIKIESKTKSIPGHQDRGLEEIHVRGGRTGEVAYMMDGMYVRNPIHGGKGTGTRLNLFAIREFDWQPGGFNAEYGDALAAVSNWHTATGRDEIEYHFKYETSKVGAMINSAMGKNLATENYDLLRGYDDYNIGLGGPVLGIPKLNFWISGQVTTEDNYEVYKFDNNIYRGRKFFLNQLTTEDIDTIAMNQNALVYPWDDVAGYRGFGFSKTWDVFAKLSYKILNNLKFNATYWQVANHMQSFSSRYTYWDQGKNELFRDTYRYTASINHSLTPRTFYTLRYARFIQDTFIGVRQRDNDGDGYPNWFEWRNKAGYKDMSDPNNPYVVPYLIGEDGDTIRYTNVDPVSGWYHGATPGLYSWEMAEDFEDRNGNGIYDPGIDFFDKNIHDVDNSGDWTGPEMIKELYFRDGSYWLEPEMYESYVDFQDYESIWQEWENVPGYYSIPINTSFIPGSPNPYYYMPDLITGVGWDEGFVFGGHDYIYSDSRAETNEYRFDITSQLTDKWKLRLGIDWKSHRLNFYEVAEPWLGAAAYTASFAEFWQDTGPDSLVLGDEGYIEADEGEENGRWDPGEQFSDANGNGKWDQYREPVEVSTYFQNTFEVPWMVINWGVRLDAVDYNGQIWSDTLNNYSPGRPWFYSDLNNNDKWDNGEEASDAAGLPRQKVFLKDSKWFYKISPRIGFSHVITDKSTFTFNYGLYYQTVRFATVYLNSSKMENPEELFEQGGGNTQAGNSTIGAERTQEYMAGFNVQVGESWSYSIMAWAKDMDQMQRFNFMRSGVYKYQVAQNGDYGSARGIDLTLKYRGRSFSSEFQYTGSIAKTNSEYAWQSISGQYVDAPSQEFLPYYDRPHDITFWLYTTLPFGINTSLSAMYTSGYPYTPLIFRGKDPEEDARNPNSKRGPASKQLNMSFSKNFDYMGHDFYIGLNIYNLLDIRYPIDVYQLTGLPDDPGVYYTNQVGLPGTDPNGAGVYADKSSAYYDRPWRSANPRQMNFFIRFDFE